VAGGTLYRSDGAAWSPAAPGVTLPAASPVDPGLAGGRLTLTSGTPVTTADVTSSTTVYYAPYLGNRVSLYDGAAWQSVAFPETSLALGTLGGALPHDVFGYLSGGALALELLAWSSGTARATALARQDGALVKSGAPTRKYLGTFYTTTTTTTADSLTRRLLWNHYNRVTRGLSRSNGTSHTYATSTWRLWNNDSTQVLDFVAGLAEDAVPVGQHVNTVGTSSGFAWGLGVNWSSGAPSLPTLSGSQATQQDFGSMEYLPPAAGYSSVSVLELGTATVPTFTQYYATLFLRG
jgi:hypothetical protein